MCCEKKGGRMSKIVDSDDVRYTKRHEWIMLEDDVITVGVTDYGQKEIEGVSLVDLPAEDIEVNAGDEVATVEGNSESLSVIAPMDGLVVDVNRLLEDTPDLVNADPYGDGWLFRLEITNLSAWRDLLTAEEYEKYIAD